MTVKAGLRIGMQYTLKDTEGQVLDTNVGREPLLFVQGQGAIIPGLDRELVGMKVGESKKVTVKPEDAYGLPDPQKHIDVPIAQIPADARKVGTQLSAEGPGGQPVHPVVAEVNEEHVKLDFNHPLAGRTLHFDVEILSVAPVSEPDDAPRIILPGEDASN